MHRMCHVQDFPGPGHSLLAVKHLLRHFHFFTFRPGASVQENSHNDCSAGSRTGHGVHQGSQRSGALYCYPIDFYVVHRCVFTCSLQCALTAFFVALLSCYILVPFTTRALLMYGSRPIVHTCSLVPAYTEDCCHTYLYALCISAVCDKRWNMDQRPPCWGTNLLLALQYTALR